MEIDSADRYAARLLEHGRVISSFSARRARIAAALDARSRELDASLAVTPAEEAAVAALLDEVTALVEWPAVYAGRFEEQYLEVPQECLILTMRTNQKYFPLFDREGRLLPRFLIVSNMDVADPSAIVDGNERVVRPRLADARFFFDQDRKLRLADRVPRLAEVVYHARLGSQAERSARIEVLAGAIAQALGRDPAPVQRAARLAKADLLTGMVGEFPELQGIMGRYYARHDGEPAEVAQAISEHYQPRFAGDVLPASSTGSMLALADKLETLAGIWGIGQRPSGEKDPFALRRHALGVVRLLVEQSLPLELGWLIGESFRVFGDLTPAAARFEADAAGLHAFIADRLRGYLRERGCNAADIEAVLAVDAQRLDRTEQRLAALAEFRQLPQFEALAAANKRIANILRKSDAAAGDAAAVRTELLAEPAEAALHRALVHARPAVDRSLQQLDFTGALEALAALREPVDAFFEAVMVNAPEPQLRSNRLALLRDLRQLMNLVADLSRL
jgi:glycyl-tRNA synthetase beta chain